MIGNKPKKPAKKRDGMGHKPPKAKPESALEKAWKVSGRDPKALRRSK